MDGNLYKFENLFSIIKNIIGILNFTAIFRFLVNFLFIWLYINVYVYVSTEFICDRIKMVKVVLELVNF